MNRNPDHEQRRRSYVSFPQAWEHLKSSGLGRFVTREIHTLPDGSKHVWESRRHRKGRGSRIETKGVLAPADGHRHLRWWGWEPGNLQWWIASIFTVGSLLLVIGGLHPFLPNSVVHAVAFSVAGSTCFTIANYLTILEIANAGSHVEGSDHTRPQWRWWAWMPDRIDYVATLNMFVGGLLFKLCFIFGMMKSLTWIDTDVLIWLPSLVGSLCFVVGSWFDLAEVNHGVWALRPREIDWWSCVTCLLGSIGYTVSSVYGFFGQGPIVIEQTWGNYVAVWLGSLMFLISSWLMIPEALDHPNP